MPASTLEILASSWEDELDVLKKIIFACKKADLFMSLYKNDIVIRVDPSSERHLSLEIQTSKNVDWYYKEYPLALKEPEERIPYYLFDKSINEEKLFAIAIANNYLDDLLIWKFSSKYLADNPGHIITLNRNVYLDFRKMSKIESITKYIEGWCFNLDQLLK